MAFTADVQDLSTLAPVRDGFAPGSVKIVGAGPGDPDLLTLKAARAIAAADVIFYDKLVAREILGLARADARLIYVGKAKADHAVPQSQIHDLMIAAARGGDRVVRLKGGDPFIFGRGGEEMAALQAADIAVEIVPGISAALGCAAAAGVPLTHRDHAQTLTLVTGHAQAGGAPALDWRQLAQRHQTLVVFMGVETAREIADHLIKAGRGPETPVAVIENGTRPTQKIVKTRLAAMEEAMIAAAILGPALLIIGEVARFAQTPHQEFADARA